MKCLNKYKWVKLPREIDSNAKGLMTYYTRLATRAAFRKGTAHYCGFENPVEPRMWAGGIVGLKSILGVRKRLIALWIMNQLQELGYLTWTLDADTKLLTYKITDWVVECSGAACEEGAVYASTGYGFICMPRTITQRLVDKGYKFEPGDALFDPDDRSYNRGSFTYDAYVNGVIQFPFLDGNIWRLFRFREAILNKEGKYKIICYPEQLPFLRKYFEDLVELVTVTMENAEQVLNIKVSSLL